MNNFEKIKNMTLDEMAELLSRRNDCDGCPCENNEEDCKGACCFLSVRDWLQQESEDTEQN